MSQDNKEEKSTICIRSELYVELMKEAEEKLYNVNEHIENIIDRQNSECFDFPLIPQLF